MAKNTNYSSYNEYVDQKLKESFNSSPFKKDLNINYKSAVKTQFDVVQEVMYQKNTQDKRNQQLKKQQKTLSEENSGLQQVNQNLVQKIDFNEQKS